MTAVAIIPARGGSVGVPGKNLLRIGGVPLVARAVYAALAAETIHRVIVSTDDAAIARVAKDAGAEIVRRPDELAGNLASSESAVLHVLESVDSGGEVPDVVVMMQATSPFTESGDIDAAVARVVRGNEDVVFSAVETHDFLWSIGARGAEGVNHDPRVRPMRQERRPEFRETGAFYVLRRTGFIEARHRFFGRIGVHLVDPRWAVDIDTPDDVYLARALATRRESGREFDLQSGRETDLRGIDVDAVVTDFDGVHTDDRAHITADGTEFVSVSRSDGMGIAELRRAGVPVLILSTETNPVVTARAHKLGVDVIQDADDKAAALAGWCADRGISPTRVAYLGNDINDLGALALVGFPICVADAQPAVREASRVILTRRGGQGAVRELSDRVLQSRGTARLIDVKPEEKPWPYASAAR